MSRAWRIVAAALVLAFAGGPALARPWMMLGVGSLMSPSAAMGSTSTCPSGSTQYNKCTTHTPGLAAWSQTPPEIVAQAKALGLGRVSAAQWEQNVFDYVRNNIATEFHFGLSKGARGALIDQSGTAFDQADLMVQMLRYGGVSANYQIGYMTLTAQQFGQWTGFVQSLDPSTQTFTVDAKGACVFLRDGMFPGTVNGTSTCSSLSSYATTVTITHIWVIDNDTGYVYDPSFKRHTLFATADLPAAMGCGTLSAPTCGSTATTQAFSTPSSGPAPTTGLVGTSPNTATYWQDVNQGAVQTQLQTYANHLQCYIQTNSTSGPCDPQTNNRFAQLQEIVGGKTIDRTYNPTVGTTLPYTSSVWSTFSGSTGLPDQFRAKIAINLDNLVATLWADEIAGKRIRIFTYGTGSTAQLVMYADDLLLTTASCSICGVNTVTPVPATMGITVYSPYLNGLGTFGDPYPVENITSPITVIAQWGDAGPSTQQFYADLQAADPSPFHGGGSTLCNGSNALDACREDSQATLAAQALAQQSQADRVIGAITALPITHHFRLGTVSNRAYGGSPSIAVEGVVSVGYTDALAANETAAFSSIGILAGTLYGSVVQQTGDLTEPTTGIAALVKANAQHIKLVNVPNGTLMPALFSNGGLTSYSSARQTNLNYLSSVGVSYMLPQVGQLSGTVDGGSFANSGPNYVVGASVNETSAGAAGWLTSSPAPSIVDWPTAAVQAAAAPSTGGLSLAAAPDIVTGAGGFPSSLPFQRSYASDFKSQEIEETGAFYGPGSYSTEIRGRYAGPEADVSSRLGGGWAHNYDITARIKNDGLKAMGRDSALDAAAFIAGLYTLIDTRRTAGFQRDLSSIFEADWLSGRLTGNAISINRSGSEEEFQLLPTGVYNPPPGSAASVAKTGSIGTLTLQNYQGLTGAVFDYSGVAITYTDKAGAVMSFLHSADYLRNYSGGNPGLPVFRLDSWSWPDGMKVAFSYSTDLTRTNAYYYLTQVANSFGRTLNFTSDSDTGSESFFRHRILAVTDDNGRQVIFTRADCPNRYANNGVGGAVASYLNCNTLNVTQPDGHVFKYGYVAGTDSPDPTYNGQLFTSRPNYRLRRLYKPSDATTPVQTVAYDELFRLKTSTDKLGNVSQSYLSAIFPSDLYKRLESVDPIGNTTVTLLDRLSNPIQVDGPRTDVIDITTFAYDSAGRLITTTYPEGNSTSLAYDVRSNVLSATQHSKPGSGLSDIVTSTVYNEGATVFTCSAIVTCNQPYSSTDARTNVSNFTYLSGTGLIYTAQAPADTSGTRPQTTYGYSTYNTTGAAASTVTLLTSKTDKITSTVNVVTNFAYNAANKYVPSTTTVDPSGLNLITTYTYDSVGNLLQVDGARTDAADTQNYAYDPNRRPVFSIAPDPDNTGSFNRAASRNVYDPDGLLIEVDRGEACNGIPQCFQVDARSTSEYDGIGRKTADVAWDGTSNLVKTSVVNYSYDADGRVLCTATRMNPAVFGSLPTDACALSTTGAQGPDRIVKATYDAAGNVLKQTRAYGITTTNGFIVPLQQDYETYAYTTNGKPYALTDARGNLSTYTFDGFDRITKLNFPVTGVGGGSSDSANYEQYGYDAGGNVTSKRLRSGETIAYTYDALNRMTLKDIPASTANDVNYSYDLLGRRLYARFNNDSAQSVDYVWDKAGRLTTETAYGRALAYQYDNDGDRTQIFWPTTSLGNYWADYVYNEANQLAEVREISSTDYPFVAASYGHSALGQLVAITRARGSGVAATGVISAYSYDKLNRTPTWNQVFATTPNSVTFGMAYNNAGQITTRTISNSAYAWVPPAPATTNKTFDGINRDTTLTAISGYDGRGNVVNDGTRTFTYDLENKLLTVANGGGTLMTLTYDPLGRLRQTVAGSTTTQFLYSGDDLVGEYDGSGNRIRTYVPTGLGGDTPLLWKDSTHQDFFIADQQGSIVATASQYAAPTATYTYGPYGEPNSWTGARFRYTGQIMLPEAQLYFYKARVYDPIAGRFLQNDPIGYEGGTNVYGYTGGDPVNESDPDGTRNARVAQKIDPSLSGGPGVIVTGRRGSGSSLGDLLGVVGGSNSASSSASAPSVGEMQVTAKRVPTRTVNVADVPVGTGHDSPQNNQNQNNQNQNDENKSKGCPFGMHPAVSAAVVGSAAAVAVEAPIATGHALSLVAEMTAGAGTGAETGAEIGGAATVETGPGVAAGLVVGAGAGAVVGAISGGLWYYAAAHAQGCRF